MRPRRRRRRCAGRLAGGRGASCGLSGPSHLGTRRGPAHRRHHVLPGGVSHPQQRPGWATPSVWPQPLARPLGLAGVVRVARNRQADRAGLVFGRPHLCGQRQQPRLDHARKNATRRWPLGRRRAGAPAATAQPHQPCAGHGHLDAPSRHRGERHHARLHCRQRCAAHATRRLRGRHFGRPRHGQRQPASQLTRLCLGVGGGATATHPVALCRRRARAHGRRQAPRNGCARAARGRGGFVSSRCAPHAALGPRPLDRLPRRQLRRALCATFASRLVRRAIGRAGAKPSHRRGGALVGLVDGV